MLVVPTVYQPRGVRMTTLTASATIGDRFAADSGRFPLSGVQALIRLIVDVRRADRAPGPEPHLTAEPQQADRVVLEDLGPDLRLDVEQLEVAQPAFRGEQRIVGAEQHLVLQVGTGRADQLRREVLR